MNYKHFLFFTQYINTFFTLEELPLIFKKLNSKECKMLLNDDTDIKKTLEIMSNELSFLESNTQIQTIQNIQTVQTITDKAIPTNIQLENNKQQTITVYEQQQLQSNILQKNGKASFYFRVGNDVSGCPSVQTFNDGNSYGPCNNGDGVKYNGDSETKYWVAIKNAELHCGKTITINYQSNSIKLKVMDKCPSCSDYDLDMSLDALIELTGSVETACSINTTPPMISWNFN